jgi:hypothetical protein
MKPVITWKEHQVVPKWTVWTGSIGEVYCFTIKPLGDLLLRQYDLDCGLPGERTGWRGSVAALKRKAETILRQWLKKANLKV